MRNTHHLGFVTAGKVLYFKVRNPRELSSSLIGSTTQSATTHKIYRCEVMTRNPLYNILQYFVFAIDS